MATCNPLCVARCLRLTRSIWAKYGNVRIPGQTRAFTTALCFACNVSTRNIDLLTAALEASASKFANRFGDSGCRLSPPFRVPQVLFVAFV